MDTLNLYDVAVMTPIVLKYFLDEEKQDRNGMLFVWLGTVFNPSKDYLRTIFEKYRTVSASFDNSSTAVQRQSASYFQMYSSAVCRSQGLRTQSHPERQTEVPTMAGKKIPARE